MINFRKKYNTFISIFFLILFLDFYIGVVFKDVYAKSPNLGKDEGNNVKIGVKENYRPGDAIQIIVFPDSTSFLNNVYPIDDEGNIFLPLIGNTNISNKTKDELVKLLLDNFSQYLKFPYIQIRYLIRISILGGVQKPGMYYVDPNLSLWEAIKKTGGPIQEDGLKKMRWERNKKVVKDNLIPYLQSGQSLKGIGFISGDQIWVPSPNRPTFWSKVGQILPVVSFAISTYTLYWAIQNGIFRGGSIR